MSKKRMLSPEQDMAANPDQNVWVQANAGTGKTSVLVQRLLRILFRDDAPGRSGILCLTYTNAGAGEMRNRILSALREWATADDDALRDMLVGVSENTSPTDADLVHAREIFFRYIDCPDMLKIRTIHGFAQEILRRFPIEAGISPSWRLADDTEQRILMRDALDKMILSRGDLRLENAFNRIVSRVSEKFMTTDLLSEIGNRYKCFFMMDNVDNYRKYFIDTTRKILELDIPIAAESTPEMLENIIEMASAEQKTQKKPVQALNDIINYTRQYIDKTIDFEKYKTAYLTQAGLPKSTIARRDYLAAELDNVFRRNRYNIATGIFDDTMAMFDVAAAFADSYRAAKNLRNVLDYEDLLLYTRRLFMQPDVMGWVLSQLDVSLNHILVDEAQDTNPIQWDIMRMLAGDFFADGDTDKSRHSLFVVGDVKQSIFAFQGADPAAFATSRASIAAQIQNDMRDIREIPLQQSFRSAAPILYAVDRFFDDAGVRNAGNFINAAHKCFRIGAPGCVEINRLTSNGNGDGDMNDYVRHIADRIDSMVSGGECMPNDIMILVQRRNPFAPKMISELKRRGIPVAGSDRIVLPDFMPVRDLLNLVRFCLDVTDDYSLCCVLKSPIYRLNNADIFDLCSVQKTAPADAKPTIFEILQSAHPDIAADINQILVWAREMGPYSFFTNVLQHNGVRDSMVAAMGNQIVDPLEEFMTICLAYERTQPGTLHHFLKWFITGSSEIKRDMDAASGVRIVTVHGSKGLEAPIVFLIDTVNVPKTSRFVPLASEKSDMPDVWLWINDKASAVACGDAIDARRDDALAEYFRLLYVAMTRPRDQLYIYGYTAHKNAPENAWHTHLWRVFGDDEHNVVRIDNGTIAE